MCSFFAWTLVACGKTTSTDGSPTNLPTDGSPTDTGSTTDRVCDALIVEVTPADQTAAFLPSQTVMATFSSAIEPSDPHSILILGASGTTELAPDGLSMTWSGDLDTKATYTATFRVCNDEAETTFTTAPPPIDLSLIDGLTFALPWSSVVVTEPENLNLFQFDIEYLLAQMVDVDVASMTGSAVGTLGSDVGGATLEPDCDLVVDDQVIDFSGNPYFAISGDFEVLVDSTTGATTIIEDFVLTGVLDDNGTTISDPKLQGMVAPESFPLLDAQDCYSPLIQQLLVPMCVPCTTSPNGYCIWIEGHAAGATLADGLDIVQECNL